MKEKVKSLIEKNPKISLGEIGKELGLKEMDVLLNLPCEFCRVADGAKFDEIIGEIGGWGEVLFVKNTPSFIIEFKTKIPSGQHAQGYYNFSMKESNFGGHLKASDIDKIFFVTQTFMGMLSKSVQFYDKNGENIFKIYVARDKERNLLKNQESAFEELKTRI